MKIIPYEIKYLKEIIANQPNLYSLNFKNAKFVDAAYLFIIRQLYNDLYNNAFVLLMNDKVIGFYLCDVGYESASLLQIYIATEYRQQGYGKMLMLHFEEHVKDVDHIELEVSMMNSVSVDFYTKNGYVPMMEYEDQGEKRQFLVKELKSSVI